MKFKLESVPPGIIVCHIQEPITKSEAAHVLAGITKFLSNGKTRVLVHFNAKAAQGEAGPDLLMSTLKQQKELATKLGGDIRYAVTGAGDPKIADVFTDLDTALRSFKAPPDLASQAEAQVQAQVQAKIQEKDEQIRKLSAENRLMAEKLKELTELVRQPSTDDQLKAAVEHYRKLCGEAEQAPARKSP